MAEILQLQEDLSEKSINDLLLMIPVRKWNGHQMTNIESVVGSMFSGKTEEMIRRVTRARIAKQEAHIFKPEIDSRYDGIYKANSHSGKSEDAIPVAKSRDILTNIIQMERQIPQAGEKMHHVLVVGIDEVQFLDEEVVPVVLGLHARGFRVVMSGLNLDFKRQPFGPMPNLLSQSLDQTELHAICTVCGEDAAYTQRLLNGKPPRYDDPIIFVGAAEAYEARCREHHVVLDAPEEKRIIFQAGVDWYESQQKTA